MRYLGGSGEEFSAPQLDSHSIASSIPIRLGGNRGGRVGAEWEWITWYSVVPRGRALYAEPDRSWGNVGLSLVVEIVLLRSHRRGQGFESPHLHRRSEAVSQSGNGLFCLFDVRLWERNGSGSLQVTSSRRSSSPDPVALIEAPGEAEPTRER